MLLECGNCGAPLDAEGSATRVKCGYCNASSVVHALRPLQPQTPPGWRPPDTWRPPGHVPADSTRVLKYHGGKRAGRNGVNPGVGASSMVLGLGVVFAGVLGTSIWLSGTSGVGDGCSSVVGRTSGEQECECRPGPWPGSVWGTAIYTTDSSVCSAALHAGVITMAGGPVKLQYTSGCARYSGTDRNEYQTRNWDSYASSYFFPGYGTGRCEEGFASAAAPAAGAGSLCPNTFERANLSAEQTLECRCEPVQFAGSVWGSGPYTTDSSVCKAAVHAGAIPPSGGAVKAKSAPGCSAYPGSWQNGVATTSWGAYRSSFYFEGKGTSACR